jgi:hypothetical protein
LMSQLLWRGKWWHFGDLECVWLRVMW